MKNIFKWLALCSAGVLFVFFVARGCVTTRNPLDFMDVKASDAVVISQRNNFFLTGDEDFIVLQFAPKRLAMILSQFKNQESFIWNSNRVLHNRNGSAQIKAFFAQAPVSALSGYFSVAKNKNPRSPWSISYDFAADEKSGRLWVYALSSYN